MKSACALAAAIFGVASLSSSPQQTVSGATTATEQSAPQATTTPAASAVAKNSVTGELMNKLDSKTAKEGDQVVLKVRSTVRTSDGMEIRKGSKLIGHVLTAKASTSTDANAQVTLKFDQVELKDGETLPIHSQIQALSPSDTSGGADANAPSPSPETTSSTPPNMYGSSPPPASYDRMAISGAGQAAAGNGPAPGTVVARNETVTIRTTSIAGILLAVSGPGRQEASSGILVGNRRNIHLDPGTNIVVAVTASRASTGGN